VLDRTPQGQLQGQGQPQGQRQSHAAAYSTSLYLYLMYFVTGHHSSFPSLQNAAAFVGFDHFEWYRAGFLLSLNTFGIFGLFLWHLIPSLQHTVILSFFSLSTTATTLFVALQRRHLMVWAIFAPKYIFESAILLVVNALVCIAPTTAP
jgi:phosphatidylinositol glycan class O